MVVDQIVRRMSQENVMDNYYEEWYNALVEDGWEHAPIYPISDDLPEPRSTLFRKDGFTIHIYRKSDALSDSISAWGPDALAVKLPKKYDFNTIKENLRLCDFCGEFGDTQPIGFAGRVCAKCHKENIARIEYPGWNN